VANTKSAQKAMRQAVTRAIRNKSARSAVRTYVKKATTAVVGGSVQDAAEVVREAVQALDRAVRKGIVHRNEAARRKSRLMGRLHQLSLGPSEAPAAVKAAPKAVKTAAKTPAKRAPGAAKSATAVKKPTATVVAKKPAARKPAAKASE